MLTLKCELTDTFGGEFGNDYYWSAVIINEAWNDTLARDYSKQTTERAAA